MFFKNGINLQQKLRDFIEQSQGIYIYCPFIKLEALKILIGEQTNIKAVFIRWETKDLITGSSDLEIYPFLKSKGITLYRNSRLHLKTYVDEYKNCFITTANISLRALNLSEYQNYNYEIGTIINNLKVEDRLYFSIIENDSILVTDNIYQQFCEQLPDKKKEFPNEEKFILKLELPDKNFLISSLPMTYSVETLYRIYEDNEYINEVELNCALHDLAIYNLPLGLPSNEFRERLTSNFFSHPFINAFLNNMKTTKEIYFGTAKDWIQKNCTDVPVPRKWELTLNIQILYRWIVKLGNGKYKIDRPNYSERLYI